MGRLHWHCRRSHHLTSAATRRSQSVGPGKAHNRRRTGPPLVAPHSIGPNGPLQQAASTSTAPHHTQMRTHRCSTPMPSVSNGTQSRRARRERSGFTYTHERRTFTTTRATFRESAPKHDTTRGHHLGRTHTLNTSVGATLGSSRGWGRRGSML